jgi:sigma-E factor negative regulatory protein RseA
MSTGSETHTTSAEELSALVDGELHAGAVSGVCGRWRNDASSRATWHAYQLIGDVLRSEDLASDAARDSAFLSALRVRLAAEPVVLAPEPVVVPAALAPTGSVARRRRWHWAAPSAVAAGFVAVAGVLVVTRSPTSPSPVPAASTSLAAAVPQAEPQQTVATPVVVAAPAAPTAEPQSSVATGQVIRDAGLDRYLAAHKHFAGSSALGVPSAFLRSATVDAAGR